MGEAVAVLGLGEAGSRYAADLLAEGITVVGYDPVCTAPPPNLAGYEGLRLAVGPEDAARSAGIVLSLNAAEVAERVAHDAARGMRGGSVYADLNTASPQTKRRTASALDGTGALFADVAVLAPVPRAGLRTPLAISGPGRGKLARFLEPFGVPVEDAGPDPGAAAGRKLLRSVFMKGLAAVVLESLDIAARAGLEDWMRRQIVSELTSADGTLVTRLVEGTRAHAARRLEEMRAADGFAAELGAADHVVRAVIARLEELASA
ncbi:MAG: NAD(P)-binding domain-containing protein [Micromonosporaceae bacterium]